MFAAVADVFATRLNVVVVVVTADVVVAVAGTLFAAVLWRGFGRAQIGQIVWRAEKSRRFRRAGAHFDFLHDLVHFRPELVLLAPDSILELVRQALNSVVVLVRTARARAETVGRHRASFAHDSCRRERIHLGWHLANAHRHQIGPVRQSEPVHVAGSVLVVVAPVVAVVVIVVAGPVRGRRLLGECLGQLLRQVEVVNGGLVVVVVVVAGGVLELVVE